MREYISILRGINVSGQKKIKMTDLKSLYETLGFKNVVTYIQSGNVIFEATTRNWKSVLKLYELSVQRNRTKQIIMIQTHVRTIQNGNDPEKA